MTPDEIANGWRTYKPGRRVEQRTIGDVYRDLEQQMRGCPIEAGFLGSLCDNECRHGRLAKDSTPPCGCWWEEL
jgi:hypothetical protein